MKTYICLHEMTDQLLTDIRGEGSPVVLVPGGLTGWISWTQHQEILARTHTAIRVQLHAVESGLQNKPLPPGYSLQWESDALGRTVDALGLETFDLVAWSYGAAIALTYAIHHPTRIRTLTLIEPPAIWVLPAEYDLQDDRKAIARLAPGPVTDDQLAWFTHFAGFVPSQVDPRTLPPWPVWSQHKQSLRIGDVVFRHQDSLELANAFTKPVLLVRGTGSSKFLHDIIEILGTTFSRAVTKELPGGHAPQIASMQFFMEILDEFIS